MFRYYSPHYIATHAGAYCRSNVNNEHGVSVSLRWSGRRDAVLAASVEYTYFPFARFGVRNPSSSLRASVEWEQTLSGGHVLYSRLSGTYDDGRNTRLLRLRLGDGYAPETGFEAAARAEGSYAGGVAGGLVYQEGGFRPASGKWRISLRSTLFCAQEWDARIYCYERDMPGTFSVPVYYGKGTGLYAVIAYRPVRWFSMSFKCSARKYFDDPDKDVLYVRLQLTLPF